MLSIAGATCAGSAIPALSTVVMMPTPSGLVRISASPGCAAALVSTRSGWIRPITDMPYLGSLSSTVCPPATAPPASATFSPPPRRIWVRIAAGSSGGKVLMLSARTTSPPMA